MDKYCCLCGSEGHFSKDCPWTQHSGSGLKCIKTMNLIGVGLAGQCGAISALKGIDSTPILMSSSVQDIQ